MGNVLEVSGVADRGGEPIGARPCDCELAGEWIKGRKSISAGIRRNAARAMARGVNTACKCMAIFPFIKE